MKKRITSFVLVAAMVASMLSGAVFAAPPTVTLPTDATNAAATYNLSEVTGIDGSGHPIFTVNTKAMGDHIVDGSASYIGYIIMSVNGTDGDFDLLSGSGDISAAVGAKNFEDGTLDDSINGKAYTSYDYGYSKVTTHDVNTAITRVGGNFVLPLDNSEAYYVAVSYIESKLADATYFGWSMFGVNKDGLIVPQSTATTTISVPADSSFVAEVTDVTGTATGGTGTINGLKASIKNNANQYWDGTGFTATKETWNDLTATTSDNFANWKADLSSIITADGKYTLSVYATDDNAGKPESGKVATTSFTLDATAPRVTSIVNKTPAGAGAFANSGDGVFTVTYSEAVTSVAAVDFALTNCTVTTAGSAGQVGTTGYYTTWDVTATPTADGAVTLAEADSGWTAVDQSGNKVVAHGTATASYTYDATAPVISTIKIGETDIKNGATVTDTPAISGVITIELTEVNIPAVGAITDKTGITLTSSDSGKDGTIGAVSYTATGVTIAYSGLANDKTYKLTIPADEIMDKATNKLAAYESASFKTIEADSYLVSLDVKADSWAATATYGDAAPTAQTVIITNAGNQELKNLLVTAGGTDSASFTVGTLSATTLAPGATATFTVVPNSNKLAAGKTHTATFVVNATSVTTLAADRTFTATYEVAKKDISLATTATKVYDGTNALVLGKIGTKVFNNTTNATEILSGDELTLTAIATSTFSSADVHATAAASTLGTPTFTGAAIGNYTITLTAKDTITAAPITAVAQPVNGATPKIGTVLSVGAITPTIADTFTTEYTVKWVRSDDTTIDASDTTELGTGATYTVVTADVGKYIGVVVTGTGNFKDTAYSAATAIVAPTAVTGGPIAGLTQPAKGQAPAGTVTAMTGVTFGAVAWTAADGTVVTSPGKFAGNTVYKATFTATAAEGYTIPALTTFTTPDNATLAATATTGAVGSHKNVVTVVITYTATAEKAISSIAVTTQPKLAYKHGAKLDLSALKYTVSYDDGTSTPDQAMGNFTTHKITPSIAHDAVLTMTNNANKITLTSGTISVETSAIAMSKAEITAQAAPTKSGGVLTAGAVTTNTGAAAAHTTDYILTWWRTETNEANATELTTGVNGNQYTVQAADAGKKIFTKVVEAGTNFTATNVTSTMYTEDLKDASGTTAVAQPVVAQNSVNTAPTGYTGATAGTITWKAGANTLTAGAKFVGSTVYTAEFDVTASAGYTIKSGGIAATGGTVSITEKTGAYGAPGNVVTVKITYTATGAATATGISDLTSPTKTTYTHGDKLDLAGLTYKLTYNDATKSAERTSANFAADMTSVTFNTRDVKSALTTFKLLGADGNTNKIILTPKAGTGLETTAIAVAKKELTTTQGTAKVTKEYDGKTDAGTPSGALEYTGVVTGETVKIAGTFTAGTYDTAAVGTTHTVTLTGTGTLSTEDANNYTIKQPQTVVITDAEIKKAALKTFDITSNGGGTISAGSTLTVDFTKMGAGVATTDVDIEWYAGENQIAGQIATVYTVTADDVTGEKEIHAKVTAKTGSTNFQGSAESNKMKAGKTALGQIGAITGTATFGETLTAGAITDAAFQTNYTIQWFRADDAAGTNSVEITGATGETYVLTVADIGKHIYLTASGIGTFTGNTSPAKVGPVQAAAAGTLTYVDPQVAYTGVDAVVTGATGGTNVDTRTITYVITAQASGTALVNGKAVNAGTYDVTVSAKGSAGHADPADVTGTFTITPVTIASAKKATVEKTGSTTLALSELMTATGFVNNETIDGLATGWAYDAGVYSTTDATRISVTFYEEIDTAGVKSYAKVTGALATGKTYYADLAVAANGFGANYASNVIAAKGMPTTATLTDYIKVELKAGSSGGVPDSPGGSVTPPVAQEFDVTFAPGARGVIADGFETTVKVKKGESVGSTPKVIPNVGFIFQGWSTNGTTTVDPTTVKITEATTFTALYTDNNLEFNKKLDKAYIEGYEDGSFGPQKSVTRAEVSAIISRTLNKVMEEGKTYTNEFTDVAAEKWYANAVGFLSANGVITGYQDNSFRPENVVTRAEFMSMVIKVDGLAAGENKFSDVSEGFWGTPFIVSGTTKNIIQGYVDGTFKPDSAITRAEVVKIMNSVLARYAQPGQSKFDDVPTTHWAHDEINAASK